MVLLKRDLLELLLGIGVLALGLVILLFTFSQALSLAQNPGTFFQSQLPQSQQSQGPTASFTWQSDDFNATFQDTSRAGDAAINSWQWEFGDGGTFNGPNPPLHRYTSTGLKTVNLTVRDANNQESRAVGEVVIAPGTVNPGSSHPDLNAGLNIEINFGDILLPLAVGILTMGLYLVMALIGGMITKAGWNLIKPKPETIRVRLKPKHLTQAFEEDAAATAAQASPQVAPPIPPPPHS